MGVSFSNFLQLLQLLSDLLLFSSTVNLNLKLYRNPNFDNITNSSTSARYNNMVSLHHIPGLFVAFTQTFGGPPSFFNPRWCIQKYGLPDTIADSKPAQTMMVVSSARMTAIGLALFTFHFQHEFAAVDTLLICLGGYVCQNLKFMILSDTKDNIGRIGRCVGCVEGRCSWAHTVPPHRRLVGCCMGLVRNACWKLKIIHR